MDALLEKEELHFDEIQEVLGATRNLDGRVKKDEILLPKPTPAPAG